MHDRFYLADMMYWPFLDIAVLGYLAIWMYRDGSAAAPTLITTVVLWQALVQANFAISKNALQELYTNNLVSLFATPITIREWLTASAVMSAFVACFVLMLCNFFATLLFGYNAASLGWLLVPIMLNLYLYGLALGTFVTALLFYFGIRSQTLVYMLGWLFGLVSGAYYPTDILPVWLRVIAHALPLTYVFDVVRNPDAGFISVAGGLTIATVLNIIYFIAALKLLEHLFNKSLERGLAQLSY